jgi:hypothetical protein
MDVVDNDKQGSEGKKFKIFFYSDSVPPIARYIVLVGYLKYLGHPLIYDYFMGRCLCYLKFLFQNNNNDENIKKELPENVKDYIG